MFFFKFLFFSSLLCTGTYAKTTKAPAAAVSPGAATGGPSVLNVPDIEELVVVRQKDKYVARRYGSYTAPKTSPVLNEKDEVPAEKKEL